MSVLKSVKKKSKGIILGTLLIGSALGLTGCKDHLYDGWTKKEIKNNATVSNLVGGYFNTIKLSPNNYLYLGQKINLFKSIVETVRSAKLSNDSKRSKEKPITTSQIRDINECLSVFRYFNNTYLKNMIQQRRDELSGKREVQIGSRSKKPLSKTELENRLTVLLEMQRLFRSNIERLIKMLNTDSGEKFRF